MEKINLNDLQKRKLKKCFLSWIIITKEVYVRNIESCKEKKLLYVILGTDIAGNRQVIASLFENSYDNRFCLEFFENKVVLMLFERNENDIKKFYEYSYEIRKFLYPYYPIRDIKRELNKLNKLDKLCCNISEINTYFLNFINKYEARRSYYRAEWLELLNLFYLKYKDDLEEYLK